jgi:hypothetical protein
MMFQTAYSLAADCPNGPDLRHPCHPRLMIRNLEHRFLNILINRERVEWLTYNTRDEVQRAQPFRNSPAVR